MFDDEAAGVELFGVRPCREETEALVALGDRGFDNSAVTSGADKVGLAGTDAAKAAPSRGFTEFPSPLPDELDAVSPALSFPLPDWRPVEVLSSIAIC